MRRAVCALTLGAALSGAAPLAAQDIGGLVQRLDAMEAEQRRLIGALEQAQAENRALRVETDQRLRDLEFRIIELEGGDPTQAFRSGGGAAAPAAAASPAPAPAPAASGDPAAEALRSAEAALASGRREDAARAYLSGYKASSDSPQAPALLAGLGATLSALGHAQQACAAFDEFDLRFPGAPETMRARVQSGRAESGCP